jgi:HK97 family phage prohead protease
METLLDLELVRAMPPAPLMRAAAADSSNDTTEDDILGVLEGHFSVFDSWYRVSSWWEGTFLEAISPGSFRKTMAERRDQIVVAFDHGFDPQIGDKVLGPIDDLREDGNGAAYQVGLLDTSYNRDLLPGLKRGLYGASFRFQVIKEEWNDEPDKSDYNPDGIPERTIKEVRLFEFGPVTYPANPAATAGMRSTVSLTDAFYEQLAKREHDRVELLRTQLPASRTRSDAAAPGTARARAARTTDPEPAHDHSDGMTPGDRRGVLYPFLRSTK